MFALVSAIIISLIIENNEQLIKTLKIMNEEIWSIRKMREDQKSSQTKNTYKRDEEEVSQINDQSNDNEPKGSVGQFFKKLQLFLEE